MASRHRAHPCLRIARVAMGRAEMELPPLAEYMRPMRQFYKADST